MGTPLEEKSTLDEIKERFDADVERFSNLETGQSATIDAPLAMELITRAAFHATAPIHRVLDIGCGAGNNSVKLAQCVATFDCDLVDLSPAMLEKARERVSERVSGEVRVSERVSGEVRIFQGDFRTINLEDQRYDVILAAAVLHHLRDDQDWESAFRKLYEVTAPGGSVWITDLVSHETQSVQALMWGNYGEYLDSLGGEEYRAKVFEYIDKEDSPRSVTYQLELLRKVGFTHVKGVAKYSA